MCSERSKGNDAASALVHNNEIPQGDVLSMGWLTQTIIVIRRSREAFYLLSRLHFAWVYKRELCS